MKKHSLLMLLPFALIVTGCSGSLSKGSIFNEKFMRRNFGDVIKVEHDYKAPETIELNLEDGVTPTHTSEYDLFQVEKDGVKGYYNVLTRSYPVPLSAGITTGLNYKTFTVDPTTTEPGIRFRLLWGVKTVEEKEIVQVFDDYGNKLYEGKNGTVNGSRVKIERYNVEENERLEVAVTVDNVKVAFAYYNVDGSFKEVITREEYYEKKQHRQFGSSMSKYGHKDIYMNTFSHFDESRYDMYNAKKGKFVATFTCPESVDDNYYIIGDKFIYQFKEKLPERAKKYDYSDGDNKYVLKTYSVNYLNGNTKQIKTKYVIESATSFKELYSTKGVMKYQFFGQIKMIGKNKVLSPVQRDVILNENLKEVADVTGVGFNNLTSIATDYYRNESGIIYNNKLKEVGFIRGDKNLKSNRVVKVDYRYGLINHKGEYIEAPLNKNADRLFEDYYALENDTTWKYVKVNEKEQVEVIKEISKDDFNKDTFSATKYQQFTRKSDSKSIYIDVTTGEEVSIPEAPEGAIEKFKTSFDTPRLGSTVSISIRGYLKDGHYTVILIRDNLTLSYASKK